MRLPEHGFELSHRFAYCGYVASPRLVGADEDAAGVGGIESEEAVLGVL
jgi:hypothetical protein